MQLLLCLEFKCLNYFVIFKCPTFSVLLSEFYRKETYMDYRKIC